MTSLQRWLIHIIARLSLAALITVPGAVHALELSPNLNRQDLTAALNYSPGTAADPIDMIAKFKSGAFGAAQTLSQYDANHAPEVWAAIELTAAISTTGRLVITAPLVSEIDLYLTNGEPHQTALRYSVFRPYQPDQHAGARLQTQPITVTAREPLLILAHVKFGALQTLSLSFEQQEATFAQSLKDTANAAAFYTFGLSILLVFLALFAALRNIASLLYALLFFVGLCFLAFLDGHLFRFAFPNAPHLQSPIGFLLLFGLAGAGFLLAARGFAILIQPNFARSAYILATACVVGYLVAFASPGPYVAAIAYILLAISWIAIAAATRPGNALTSTEARIARMLGWIVIAALLGLVLPLLLPQVPQALDVLTSAKAIYILLILAALTNFVAQVVSTRRARQDAIASEMAALAREADLSQALVTAEQNYTKARDIARTRSRQLATTSHDLRQPLMSLRMTVDSLAAQVEPEARAQLHEAFDYISSLSGTHLDAATNDEFHQTDNAEVETYAVSNIMRTVHQMFHKEAEAKGLRFLMVDSVSDISIPAMAMMRITSNLVSNAIKYTQDGGLIIGLRRKDGETYLTVSDTGLGMSTDEIERFKQEGIKGAASDGHGLGLSLCFGLAQENNLKLFVTSVNDQGTTFALQLR